MTTTDYDVVRMWFALGLPVEFNYGWSENPSWQRAIHETWFEWLRGRNKATHKVEFRLKPDDSDVDNA